MTCGYAEHWQEKNEMEPSRNDNRVAWHRDGSSDAYAWGDRSNGRLGNREDGHQPSTPETAIDGREQKAKDETKDFGEPQAVIGIPSKSIKQVAAGEVLNVALLANGQVYQWGNGNPTPVRLQGFAKRVFFVACGNDHFCALTEEPARNLLTWGRNDWGQLGHGHRRNLREPKPVGGILDASRIVHVACGCHYTFAITISGNVFSWGRNDKGQLGLTDNTKTTVTTPKPVKSLATNLGKLEKVENYFMYSRLMIACGQQHAVSWISDTEGTLMTAEQQLKMKEMDQTIVKLQNDLKDARQTIERLSLSQHQHIQNHHQDHQDLVQEPHRSLPSDSASQAREQELFHGNTEQQHHDSIDRESFHAHRRISEDEEVHEIDSLMRTLQRSMNSCKSEISKLTSQHKALQDDAQETRSIVMQNDKNINSLWQRVSDYTVRINQVRSSLVPDSRQKIGQLEREKEDYRKMAEAGEESVASHVDRLNSIERSASEVAARLEQKKHDYDWMVRIEKILATARMRRSERIVRQYVDTAQDSAVLEWMALVQRRLDELRSTELERMVPSASSEDADQSDGESSIGIEQLLVRSDARIDSVLHGAQKDLQMESHEDAAHGIVSVLLDLLRDNADLRKRLNQYISYQVRTITKAT